MKRIRQGSYGGSFAGTLRAAFSALALLIASSLCYAGTPYAEMPAGKYTLDKTHAQLHWRVSHLGLINYTARFTDFDATLVYDPKDPEKSSLEATVNPLSLETDYPYPEETDFDKKLSEGKDWLNGKKFPTIKFTSTELKKIDDKTGTITGNLNFLGVTKPMTLNVTFNGAMAKQPFSKKPTLGFSAVGKIKRSDWGLTTYVPNIGDEVELLIEAEFAQ